MYHESDSLRRGVRRARLGRVIGPILAVGLLSGCSSVPDWANPVDWYDTVTSDSTPRPVQLETEEEKAEADKPFPNLGAVPDRPEGGSAEQRRQVAEGLVADRDKAKYTDETLRAEGTESAPSVTPPAAATPPQAAAPVQQPVQPPVQAPVAATPPAPQQPTTSFGSSPTPMIAAMTRQRQAGGQGQVPSLSQGTDQSRYVPPPPASSTTPPSTVPTPAAIPNQAPALNPVTRPSYPNYPQAQASSGNILGDTFSSRLRDSASTVTTAPPNEQFISSTQPYTPTEQSVAFSSAPAQAGSPVALPSLSPLVGGSRQIAVVKFTDGSHNLTGKGRSQLKSVVAEYKKRRGIIRVVGHASSRTRDLSISQHKLVNFDISLKRAQSVAGRLTRMGVRSEDVLIEARGDSEPLYFEAMPRGEAENRRVEIFLEY